MTYELTKEQKLEIAEQHIRNISINRYNIVLSMLEENASAMPSQSILDSLQLQLSDIDLKIVALNNEIDSLK